MILRHGSLFSGIGGFDLAASWMGWENVFQVEKDDWCRKVLAKNFPKTKRYGAIEDFDGNEYNRTIDILTGGFPCQPLSKAGKRKGRKDPRFLWPEYFRLVKQIDPYIVVAENVFGLLNREGGAIFEEICSQMESVGYEVQACVIPASGASAWHKRDRVWITCIKADTFYSYANSQRFYRTKFYEQRETELQHEQISLPGSLVSPGILTGTDARVFGNPNGLSNRVDRIKGLGNAIVPQVAFEIFKAIEKTIDK